MALEDFNGRRIPLTYDSKAAFESATAEETDPIEAWIDTDPPLKGLKKDGSYKYIPDLSGAVTALTGTVSGLSSSVSALSSAVSGMSGQVSVITEQVQDQNSTIASLEELVASSYVGGLVRGRSAIPNLSDPTAPGVEYMGNNEINPLNTVETRLVYAGDHILTIHLNPAVLERLGMANAAIGDPVAYLIDVPSDAGNLRLYNTQENADAKGNTGWIGMMTTFPEFTRGTFLIWGMSGGVQTDETIGWLTTDGIDYGLFALSKELALYSRDYNFTSTELVPGFRMEHKFGFVNQLAGDYYLPSVKILVRSKDGSVVFSNSAGVSIEQDEFPPTSYPTVQITGTVLVEVVGRYVHSGVEKVQVRTSVCFGALPTPLQCNPSVEEKLIPVSDLVGRHFLEVGCQCDYGVGALIFSSSSMTIHGPSVIP